MVTTWKRSAAALAIDSNGTKVVIGAPYNDNDSTTSTEEGHARVYEWNGSSWLQMGNDIDGVIY